MNSSLPDILRVGDVDETIIVSCAAAVLRSGGVVVVPTDTVYGVATMPGYEQRLFDAKGRDDGKPIPLLVASVEAVREVATLSEAAVKLAASFWPGPLTMVLPLGGKSEGIRVPDLALTRSILTAAGGMLRVTSANRSGEPATLTAQAAADVLADHVDLVIDAGPSASGTPSTVLRVDGEEPEILRDGAIAERTWRNAL